MTKLYISAAHKSSGKTSISIGLSHALSQLYRVQVFKKGPDYIDPMWLQQASGNPVYNLDFFTSSKQYIKSQFNHYSDLADISLIEGNKGLFDGVSTDGSDSNAALAKLLKTPVILVLDTQGISRGIAPLVHGYSLFDADIEYAGIILNKVAGARHESKLINAIETYCDIPVIGSVYKNTQLSIQERHLGLVPNTEINKSSEAYIQSLSQAVSEGVNLECFKPPIKQITSSEISDIRSINTSIRIGIAKDSAFGFYYADDLEYFKKLGVELVEFNSMQDSKLPPNIQGLFIGGGFPETHLNELSNNQTLMKDIHSKITSGLPCYAECGGLMYLSNSISYKGETKKLVGIIDEDVIMHEKPQGRGYIKIEPTQNHLWKMPDQTLYGHEFHYSALKQSSENNIYAYSMQRGTGINQNNDGIIINNLIANYCHLRQTDQCNWIDYFVSFVKSCNF